MARRWPGLWWGAPGASTEGRTLPPRSCGRGDSEQSPSVWFGSLCSLLIPVWHRKTSISSQQSVRVRSAQREREQWRGEEGAAPSPCRCAGAQPSVGSGRGSGRHRCLGGTEVCVGADTLAVLLRSGLVEGKIQRAKLRAHLKGKE